MARNIFFSFHYDDVKNFKANIIRNNAQFKKQKAFKDGSIWEEAKLKGDKTIKELIDTGVKGTSVTAVLIGQGTANRKWINYEIVKSFCKGNGIIGVHINKLKGRTGTTKKGTNPLDRLKFTISKDGKKISFYELKNRKWIPFSLLKEISNRKQNTLNFTKFLIFSNFGKSYRFSEKFPEFCWIKDDGNKNFDKWVEDEFKKANN